MRLTALTLALVVVAAASLASPAAAQDKPNIVVIWGDDVGWSNISAYNHGIMGYQTPNIDRIADEGRCSPTATRSRAAPLDARPLSSANTRSAPAF